MHLFGNTVHTLEQALQYSSKKNQVIANNIANVDTPNYKAQEVVFKDVLSKTMSQSITAKRTHPKHIAFHQQPNQSQNVFISQKNTVFNHNGNNVDIDKEMSKLAKNQIYYQSLVDRINGKFNSLQMVIRGGR